ACLCERDCSDCSVRRFEVDGCQAGSRQVNRRAGTGIDERPPIAYCGARVARMPDKFEREIEEILAKLDSDAPSGERKPLSIKSARRKSPAKPQAQRTARRLPAITPTTLLFSG